MSTLVVVRKGLKAVIASDSQFGQGSTKVSAHHQINNRKIFQIEDAYIGFTGWSALMAVFGHLSEHSPESFRFGSRSQIFQTFLSLHQKLKDDYFLDTKEKDDQPVESSQWDCLIAAPSGIYQVQSYREVMEYRDYWADGSGTEYALGAMQATYHLYDEPEKIAQAGIEAACEFDKSSGLPMRIFTVDLNPDTISS